MPETTDQPYVLDNDHECDRLERQAVIAGIENHLQHFQVPDRAHVLDAGCGSGSMSRLLAARHPRATVTGVDLRPHYVAYARSLAEEQHLTILSFQPGDVERLPFPDAVKNWSLTTLRDRLVKIGAGIVRHGRSIGFQMAEVAVSRALFQDILAAIAALRPLPPPARC